MTKERRLFKRYSRRAEFKVAIGERTYDAWTEDYSVDGLRVMVGGFPSIKAGAIISLDISGINYKTSGKVVRVSRRDDGVVLGVHRLGLLYGALVDFTVTDLMLGLQRSSKTGMLHLKANGTLKNVYFKGGDMVYASSNQPEDRFEALLLKDGLVSKETLQRAAQAAKECRKFVGKVLVDMGALKAPDFFGAIKRMNENIILSTFTMHKGDFMFKEGPLESENFVPLKLSVANLIFLGVKKIRDPDAIKLMSPSMDQVLRLSSDPLDLYQNIKLEEDDRRILKTLDGKRKLKDAIAASGLEPSRATSCVMALFNTRVIEVSYHGASGNATGDDSEVSAEEVFGQAETVSKDVLIRRINSMYDQHRKLGYYGVLGVKRDTDRAAIKRAYYNAAREFHPDKHFDLPDEMHEKLNELFTYITTAYSTLSNPDRRVEYDKAPPEDERTKLTAADMAAKKFKLGESCFARSDYEAAAQAFSEAAYLVSDDPNNHYHAAVALFRAGKVKEAERTLQRAIRLDPLNPDYLAEAGHVYVKLGFETRARDSFNKALKLKPLHKRAMEGMSSLA